MKLVAVVFWKKTGGDVSSEAWWKSINAWFEDHGVKREHIVSITDLRGMIGQTNVVLTDVVDLPLATQVEIQ